jgi:nitroreductase
MPVSSRYADDALTLHARSAVLDLQLAHRSVREFAPGDVTDDHLRAMVAAAQSAPTSSNLQPWSVVVVRDRERKARLATYAAGQRFVEEAPVLLVWVADLSRARRLAARAGTVVDAADYLETTIIGFVDTALAAQNAVVAAESLGLGTVFVGAIRNHPDKVAAELGLPPHAVAAFGLAVGVPDPTESAGIKPRLPQAAVVHHERYDAEAADAHIPGYDARLAAYNQRYGLPEGGWSGRVLDGLGLPSR